ENPATASQEAPATNSVAPGSPVPPTAATTSADSASTQPGDKAPWVAAAKAPITSSAAQPAGTRYTAAMPPRGTGSPEPAAAPRGARLPAPLVAPRGPVGFVVQPVLIALSSAQRIRVAVSDLDALLTPASELLTRR